MNIHRYEESFGEADKTSRAMRGAIEEWFALYYADDQTEKEDTCQRVPYAIVSKLVRTIFGEYKSAAVDPFGQRILQKLDGQKMKAVQLALVGGECYIKPCPEGDEFAFAVIPRDNVLIFGRDWGGEPTDIGTVERTTYGKYYYTLLERRRVDAMGYLTIENRLFRSGSADSLGTEVALEEQPLYAGLCREYTFDRPVGSVGLVRMRTPMVNCVDGSADGVSVYAAAVGLIRNIAENEAQMNGEFRRGESRIITSADMLNQDEFGNRELGEHLFVGLDEDIDRVGITVFSPALREQSFLARKQEYLRNVESVVGLKRGMLSDANAEERTATEITSSAGDYNLTVIELQQMWESAVRRTAALCCRLAAFYMPGLSMTEDLGITLDWGNGILYDEDRIWEAYMEMTARGMLKPEVALGWRFNMPSETSEELERIRRRFMPDPAE